MAIFNTYIPLADPGGGALGLDPRTAPVYGAVNQLSYVCMLGQAVQLNDCMRTFTRHAWTHYTVCWIVK